MGATKELNTEPITHFMTGACIGRAGFNRRTAYATLAATLAAEAADIDILWGFGGPVDELKHHRGITHTFLAAPVVAAVVVGFVWAVDRWVFRRRVFRSMVLRRRDQRRIAPPEKQGAMSGLASGQILRPVDGESIPQPEPVRWGWVYAAALVAALSHLLLDWTNNYGLRPFFPFNARWYSGDLVFIAEPVLWGILGLALIIPALLGLADREIGAPKTRGQSWAIVALIGMVALWGWRWVEHDRALAMVSHTQVASAPVVRVAMEPYPVNPMRWHAVVETAAYYQTAEVNTHAGVIDSDPHRDVLFKPYETAAVRAARQTKLGQVYLDWGRWAVVEDMGAVPIAGLAPPQLGATQSWTAVQFNDLRFQYSYLGEPRTHRQSPLGAWVYIVDGHEDAGEVCGGRVQR